MGKSQTLRAERVHRRQHSLDERIEHLANWKMSGLSAQAYAREHGIRYKSLYAWRSQSRRASERSQPEFASKEPSFVPVHVGSPGSGNAMASTLKITLRRQGLNALECVVIGAANATELVSLVKSLKQEVFDV